MPGIRVILFVTCVLIWGSSFILMKKGLVVYSAEQVASLRLCVAGLTLAPISLWCIFRAGRTYPWKHLALSALTGSIVPAYLFATAQTELPSSIAGVLNSLSPIFTLLIGALVFRSVVRSIHVVGVVLGWIGAVALVLHRQELHQDAPWFNVSLILLATMLYGFTANFNKRFLTHMPAQESIALAFFTAILPTGAYLLTTDFWHLTTHHEKGWQALGAIVLLGSIGSALASVLFMALLKRSSALFAASVTYCIPIVAVVWGTLDGEAMTWHGLLAMSGILLGVYLVSRPASKPSTAQQ
jgi:drug/metabolite transporter (DMT)-like permease